MSDSGNSVRLSKRMVELGLCSRREADAFIERGLVKVDGVVVDVLGSRVQPGQEITLEKRALEEQAARVTILLHKPVGFAAGLGPQALKQASQLIKPENRWQGDRSYIDFLRSHLHGLSPAGQLDIDASGLLVLSQDGRIGRLLTSEQAKVEEEYLVQFDGELIENGLALLNHGLSLDGQALPPAKVSRQSDHQLRFALREGKRRQIRRMCEQVGLTVLSVKRIRIGRIALADLPLGQWRYLEQHERF